MSSSEDYLDSLLASALQQNNAAEEKSGNDTMTPEEIAALFDMLDSEKTEAEEPKEESVKEADEEEFVEETAKEETAKEEIAKEEIAKEEPEEPEFNFDLDAMLDKVISETIGEQKETDFIQEPEEQEESEDQGEPEEQEESEDQGEPEGQKEPEAIGEPEKGETLENQETPATSSSDIMTPEEIAALFDELDADKEQEEKAKAELESEELLALLQEEEQEDLSEENIIAQLEAAKRTGEEQAREDAENISENQDIFDLLAAFGEEDDGLTDIGEMLQKSDQNELLSEVSMPQDTFNAAAFLEEDGEEISGEDSQKQSKKKKGEKKGLFDFFKSKKKEATETALEEETMAEGATETSAVNNLSQEETPTETTKQDATDFMSAFGEEDSSTSVADLLGLDLSEAEDNVASENKAVQVSEDEKGESKEEKTAEKKEKKPGFFQRLFHALTEEVPEEENAVPEQKATKLSDENLNILSELDAEEEIVVNKDKKKKKKAKEKEKKAKKKPAPKPKKVKVLTEEKEDSKTIPRKHVVRTFALSFSILAAILLITMYVPSLLLMQDARDAYYQGDYRNAYLSLYGKDLNESDQLIYERSKLIVLLERKWEAYVNYDNMNMQAEALDVLLQGVARYEELKARAEEYGVLNELDATRSDILEALQTQFGISEAEAMEIISYDALDYNDKLNAVISGTDYVPRSEVIASEYGIVWERQEPEEAPVEESGEMQDLLPEEEAYLNGNNETPQENATLEEETEEDTPSSEPTEGTTGENPVEVLIESEQF